MSVWEQITWTPETIIGKYNYIISVNKDLVDAYF